MGHLWFELRLRWTLLYCTFHSFTLRLEFFVTAAKARKGVAAGRPTAMNAPQSFLLDWSARSSLNPWDIYSMIGIAMVLFFSASHFLSTSSADTAMVVSVRGVANVCLCSLLGDAVVIHLVLLRSFVRLEASAAARCRFDPEVAYPLRKELPSSVWGYQGERASHQYKGGMGPILPLLLQLLPEGSSNHVQTFRGSSGHVRERLPTYVFFKKPKYKKLWFVKLPRNTECCPSYQAELDSLEDQDTWKMVLLYMIV